MSIYSKLSALLTAANTKTGESDTTLTDAIQTLIDGYGGGGGGGSGIDYDTGSFTPTSDTTASDAVSVPHRLGAVPDLVIVWTDDFADDTADPYASGTSMVGYIWFGGYSKMRQRLNSTNSTSDAVLGANITLDWSLTYPRTQMTPPTSTTYYPKAPTSTEIKYHRVSNSTYWRDGVTYKYLVAKVGAWNV